MPPAYSIFVAGYRAQTTSGQQNDVTVTDQNIIPVPLVAIPMKVNSTSNRDSAHGSGVRAIDIYGLDNNFNEIEETLALNGTTPVNTALSYRRINAMHARDVGAPGAASVGLIGIYDLSGEHTYNAIGPGVNMSLQAHYTVPRNRTCKILSWGPCVSGAQSQSIALMLLRATCAWKDRTILPGTFIFQDIIIASDGPSSRVFIEPRIIPATADIKVSAILLNGSHPCRLSASIEMRIE